MGRRKKGWWWLAGGGGKKGRKEQGMDRKDRLLHIWQLPESVNLISATCQRKTHQCQEQVVPGMHAGDGLTLSITPFFLLLPAPFPPTLSRLVHLPLIPSFTLPYPIQSLTFPLYILNFFHSSTCIIRLLVSKFSSQNKMLALN